MAVKPHQPPAPDDTVATTHLPWNDWIAPRLHEAGDLLTQQGANPFRAGAYHRAARYVADARDDIAATFASKGLQGLIDLPHIGHTIAAAIAEMLQTGRWRQLERMRGEVDPENLFQVVPGIGPKLSQEIHDRLHIDTLEALEIAAHDGRLEHVPGIGPGRLAIIRQNLASKLAGRRPLERRAKQDRPPVEDILDVDREYVSKAKANQLRKIAPRRFNEEGKAWLPILHTERGRWQFTALFSNTARAHQLDRTKDWVVVFYHSDGDVEDQCTVVTEHFGSLRGSRVVRGRELECEIFYGSRS